MEEVNQVRETSEKPKKQYTPPAMLKLGLVRVRQPVSPCPSTDPACVD